MCLGDFDCPGNLKCLPGSLAWAPPDVNGTFCDCEAPGSGFLKASPSDMNCAVLGPHTVYLMVVSFTFLVAYTVLVLHSLSALVVLKRRAQLSINDLSIALLLLTGANGFALACYAIRLCLLAKPLDAVYNLYGSKVHPLTTSLAGTMIVGQSLMLFGYSYLPLVWSDVVFRTHTLRLDGHGAWKVRLGVRGYQLLILIGRLSAFVVTGTAAYTFSTTVAALGLFGTLVIFAFARRWFVQLLKSLTVNLNESRLVLYRINRLTNVVVASMAIATSTFLVFVILNAQGEFLNCPKGEVCLLYLLKDLCETARCSFPLKQGQSRNQPEDIEREPTLKPEQPYVIAKF